MFVYQRVDTINMNVFHLSPKYCCWMLNLTNH